ncbi:hypothetical protein [Streptomyces atratus]|uniref:hypothetical protein n=1 Tax=Streptomyces atratus TaxID=1893 RepID=UPI0022500972|nr:hypothetical protein [Streptomyces atratus]MCX5341467.1 hypothetical protein [Streptomyces atratus]
MSRRAQLPPPPPPVEIRTWPDREALLADRAVVLGELVKMHVSPGRLVALWLWGALCAVGWSLVGSAIVTFEQSYDIFSTVLGVILVGMGACCMVPAIILVVIGLRRDRHIRRLLAAWGELDRDPARDARLRMPGVSLVWLLMSFALCALGLYACIAVPATAEAGRGAYGLVALAMGLGMTGWIVGLIGITKAFAHRRWVLRALIGAPAPEPLLSVGDGAHR